MQRCETREVKDRKIDQVMSKVEKCGVVVAALKETKWFGDDVYHVGEGNQQDERKSWWYIDLGILEMVMVAVMKNSLIPCWSWWVWCGRRVVFPESQIRCWSLSQRGEISVRGCCRRLQELGED